MHFLDIAIDLKTFRPTAFEIPLLLFALDQLERRRFGTMGVLLVIAMSAQEDFAAVLALVGTMVAVSYVLGQSHSERATGEPFEAGVVSVGFGRLRVPAHFYLVAVFFVIFDLEAVFIFAWAVVLYESGWAGYIEILIFIGTLVAALIYLWRIGALDWGPERRMRRSAPRRGSRRRSPRR
jgi:NADH-quinone oxidoreductase subunit A